MSKVVIGAILLLISVPYWVYQSTTALQATPFNVNLLSCLSVSPLRKPLVPEVRGLQPWQHFKKGLRAEGVLHFTNYVL